MLAQGELRAGGVKCGPDSVRTTGDDRRAAGQRRRLGRSLAAQRSALPTSRAALVAQWLEPLAARKPLATLVVRQPGRMVAALPLCVAGRGPWTFGRLPGNAWTPAGELLLDPHCDVPAVCDRLAQGARRTRIAADCFRRRGDRRTGLAGVERGTRPARDSPLGSAAIRGRSSGAGRRLAGLFRRALEKPSPAPPPGTEQDRRGRPASSCRFSSGSRPPRSPAGCGPALRSKTGAGKGRPAHRC